jgi:hypothetical protein
LTNGLGQLRAKGYVTPTFLSLSALCRQRLQFANGCDVSVRDILSAQRTPSPEKFNASQPRYGFNQIGAPRTCRYAGSAVPSAYPCNSASAHRSKSPNPSFEATSFAFLTRSLTRTCGSIAAAWSSSTTDGVLVIDAIIPSSRGCRQCAPRRILCVRRHRRSAGRAGVAVSDPSGRTWPRSRAASECEATADNDRSRLSLSAD